MGSQNHASVWDVGYFPPCAVAATCRIGVRPRAASCVSMPVPCTAPPPVQAVQGLRHEGCPGRRRRVPEEHVTRLSNKLLRRLHARTLESRSLASQPVGNSLLFQNVPRSCQDVSTSSDAAASGLSKTPPSVSARLFPCRGFRPLKFRLSSRLRSHCQAAPMCYASAPRRSRGTRPLGSRRCLPDSAPAYAGVRTLWVGPPQAAWGAPTEPYQVRRRPRVEVRASDQPSLERCTE